MPKPLSSSHTLIKTAIIGASGFIGARFLASYRSHYPNCVGTARKENASLKFLDLEHPDIRPLRLSETGHQAALILAAVTNVALCQHNAAQSWRINVTGTIELIRQLAAEGIRPIFFSSDYVFDGKGGYTDDAPLSPTTEYGRQKAEVEQRIGDISPDFLVARLSKTFSTTRGDGSLLDNMACRIMAREHIRAARDQIFSPTHVDDVIETIARLQAAQATGTFNVCSGEAWSRYDLACELAKHLGMNEAHITPIALDELDEGFHRPHNTSLIPARLQRMGVTFRTTAECIATLAVQWRQ